MRWGQIWLLMLLPRAGARKWGMGPRMQGDGEEEIDFSRM